MQVVREAGRRQIVATLMQQAQSWPVPADTADAACTLPHTGSLACDNAAVQQVLGAQAPRLAGLLAAHHGIEARTHALAIDLRGGRYHVSLDVRGAD